MPIDEDDFKKVRDEIERPLAKDLKAVSTFINFQIDEALKSGGEPAAHKEMIAVCVALGALYQWLRDALTEDPTQAALIDEFVLDTKKRFVSSAAARLATEIKGPS